MKNATRYCAGPAYYRMCSTDVYCSKQTGNPVAPKETITHHFFVFANWANCRCGKICGGAENVVKTETQQTFVNGLLGFITLGIYTPLEARVYAHNNCIKLPIDMGNSIYYSLIYFWVPSSCFLHSDQPLSEGEIIPIQQCLPVGEAALSTPEAVVASH